MTDIRNPSDPANALPTDALPTNALIFPDEEYAIIEGLRPERLVERVLVAVRCDRPELAHRTLVLGPNLAIEQGFGLPGREPAKPAETGD